MDPSSTNLQSDVGESVVEVTNKSNEFSNFGIKITVLENSLPKGIDMCALHISFELSTDFEIPANSELVSSIYRVKCEPQVQFKKPVTLEIQHCASLSCDYQQRLVFARATYQSEKFEILEGGHFPIGERYGSIQLTCFSCLGVFIRKVFGFPIEKIYSALLFRNNLRCDVIDTKCVICQDLDTHVKVIREALERDGFTKEMNLDQIQFENAVEMELHSENSELWTVTRVTSTTLSRDRIDGYSRVLDSNDRRGVIPAIHYRFKLKEKNISDSVNFLLMKTDLDEESHHLILHIDLPQTPGTSDSATQRESPFTISIQPKDVSCKPGEKVELTISTAPSATTYQWFFENQAISLPDYKGQTSERLLISTFLPKHKGAYWCVTEDASGIQITSRHATLTAEGEKIERQELQLIGKILEKSAIDFGDYGVETVHLLNANSDVTYEEMEFVMKLKQSTQVLSINLKQEITSRLKEEKLYTKAIKEKVSLTYTKIIALGPGQVGKSTFLCRLLGIMEGSIQKSPPETQPQSSTGITEMREACIQYTRVTGAINKKQWRVLKHDLHDQLSGLMSLISQQQGPHLTTQSPSQIASKIEHESLVDAAVQVKKDEKHDQTIYPANEGTGIQTLESLPVTTQNSYVAGLIQTLQSLLTTVYYYLLQLTHYLLLFTQGVIATRQSALMPPKSDIDKTIREFEELKQECRLSPDRMKFEMLFNVADVGGQPAFLEMLPSLTIGPALYLVFMNLKQELSSRYPVPFKCKNSTTNLCKDYSYTSEEVLFSALSSIACFGHPDEQVEMYVQKPAADDEERKESLAVLVGTFLDEVNDNKIQLTNQQLEERLEETAFYKDGLILDNSFSLLVNNMSADNNEIKKHRKKLEAIICAKFRKYQIPTQWLMLSICLKLLARNQNKYHVSFDDCVKLGKHLDMDKEMVSVALQFLHKYIGLVMYFPRHENLKEIVICDPQVVFSTISELIFNIYDHNQFQVSQAQYDDFVKTGCFSPQDIMLINNEDRSVNAEKEKLLPIDTLVDLLEYLNIAAKVPGKEKVLYFLPAVLQSAEIDAVKRKKKGENEELLPEPICIRFKTGYIPLGFVCALIANLTVEKNFDILFDERNKLYKNMIQFRFKGVFNVTVVSLPRYCEFRVTRQPSVFEVWSKDGCPLIMETVRTVANKVIYSMQHGLRQVANDSSMYEFAFHCPIHSDADFGQESLAELDRDYSDQHIENKIPDTAMCTTCKTAIHPLTPEMMVWFGKVPNTRLKICEQPARKDNVISIRADGVRPLTYQWLLGGKKLCDSDDQDYDDYATDKLVIKDKNLLSGGVFKCQVKDKFDNCVFESNEFDLFEDVLRKTLKLETPEIIKLKEKGYTSIRELEGVQLDELDLNPGEKKRMKLLFEFVQTKFDGYSGGFSTERNEELIVREHYDTKSVVKTPSLTSLSSEHSAAPVQRTPLSSLAGPSINQVTLQELIKQYSLTDEQLNSKIEDSDNPKMALYFDNVCTYSNAMGLAPAEQADVNRLYYSEGTQIAMMNCLQVWKQRNSSRATYRALLDIVLELGKGDTADKICQQLTKRGVRGVVTGSD